MGETPKISIITAVYNNVHEIGHAIESVISQTYPTIDYIVVDGGSTDGTTDIVKKYGSKVHTFLSEPDHGIYDALNKGLRLANGDVVGILHSDDLFYSNETLAHIASLFEEKGCDAVYGDLLYVSKTDTQKVIRYWKSAPFNVKNFKKGWMPAHPTLFMKKEVLEKRLVGLFQI